MRVVIKLSVMVESWKQHNSLGPSENIFKNTIVQFRVIARFRMYWYHCIHRWNKDNFDFILNENYSLREQISD